MPLPAEPTRILIVEDESAHAEVICRALQASALNASIRLGASLHDYRLLVKAERPDIALLDLNLTDGRATEVLTAPASAGAFPVLIMTAFGNEALAVEAMKAGALDYIVKSPEAFAAMPQSIERAQREWHTLQEHKRISEELRQSETENRRINKQFQALLDGIPDHLMLVSPGHSLLWMNRSALAYMGRDNPFAPPPFCYQGWARSQHPCPNCPVAVCFATGLAAEMVMPVQDRIFAAKAFPIKNEQGEVESVIKLATDITEKIKLREESDRNSRLAAVGELSAGIAHEVNNPAGLILSNLATISEAFDDIAPILDDHYHGSGDFPFGGLTYSRLRQQFPEILRETGEASRRIRQIVEDLKSFAQGGSPRELENFSLKDAVQRSLRLTGNLLREATQSFTLDLAEEVMMIHGCERRVEQVLVNLIANACQSLPDRHSAITLTTRYDDDKGAALIILRDEGIGIPSEHLAKLATPFFTTRQGTGGTGLGLSVTFGIVKEHGGTIHFASEAGKGTTVTITLPASIHEGAP